MSNMCPAFFKRSSANVVSSNSPTKSPLTPPASVIFTREWSSSNFCYSSLDTSIRIAVYTAYASSFASSSCGSTERDTRKNTAFVSFVIFPVPKAYQEKMPMFLYCSAHQNDQAKNKHMPGSFTSCM